MRSNWMTLSLAGALTLVACSDDLTPATFDAGPGDDGGGAPSSHVTTSEPGDGTFTTEVDATAMDAWVGFDFQTRGELAESDASWDLGFRRFEIKLDGGASGPGGVAIAALPGADFAALERAPAAGFTTDGADALAFSAGGGWYAYDPATHVLTPRDIVYVVRSVEGDYFKLAITSYYDAAGTAGHLAFRWAGLAAPAQGEAP